MLANIIIIIHYMILIYALSSLARSVAEQIYADHAI